MTKKIIDIFKPKILKYNKDKSTDPITTEIIRSGLNSIIKGQIESATAFGMTKFMAFKRILLPQAIRQSIPAYSNEIILMIKASSLALTSSSISISMLYVSIFSYM